MEQTRYLNGCGYLLHDRGFEHSTKSRHDPACGIVGPPGFYLAFLKEGELFAKEQVFSSVGAAGSHRRYGESQQVAQDHGHRTEAVLEGEDDKDEDEGAGPHVLACYCFSIPSRILFLRPRVGICSGTRT